MRKKILKVLSLIVIVVLSFRYRWTIKGYKDVIKKKRLDPTKSFLFLPNHPAAFDPLFVMAILWRHFTPRPVVVEYIFRSGILSRFMKFVGGLSIPNFLKGNNSWKQKKGAETLEKAAAILQSGGDVLFYPSGKLRLDGIEVLGGASGVHGLLQACPDVHVVLIKTEGLWGSMSSRALTGKVLSLPALILKGFFIILKNGLFFVPKRKVSVEFCVVDDEFPRKGSRFEINRYLEKWYNGVDLSGKLQPEPLIQIPYYFWDTKLPQTQFRPGWDLPPLEKIPDSIQFAVKQEIARITKQDPQKILPQDLLQSDLGMDSLDVASLLSFIKYHYQVSHANPDQVTSVLSVYALAGHFIKPVVDDIGYPEDLWKWKQTGTRPGIEFPEGICLPEVFLNSCDRLKDFEAVGDLWRGPRTYRDLKKGSLLLAELIKPLPGKYIGILLPSSGAVNCLVIACLLAGKTPVMLNWTVGSRHLNSAQDVVSMDVVISSWKFIDRLDNVDLGGITDKLLFIEDLVEGASLGLKLKTLRMSRKNTHTILKCWNYNTEEQQKNVAVILFTSGSEGMPKAVPLTHFNLLENQRGGLASVEFLSCDVMLSALPPFHSFGFSLTGLFPLLMGLRVVYYPNPLDHEQILHLLKAWSVSVMGSAPSFLRGIAKLGSEEQLKTMRVLFVGAEKMPVGLIEDFLKKQPKIEFVEGYGITECGPIICVNTQRVCCEGIGKPIKGVDVLVVDQDSYLRLPPGKRGLLLAKGPGIFGGYWGQTDQTSSFVFCEGQMWYKTGDLAVMDEEGHLVLSGRSKRFVKIGGEMISLGAIEDTLNYYYAPKDSSVPVIAVCDKEEDGQGVIVVLSPLDLDLKSLNNTLRSAGFSSVVKVHEIVKLGMIPLTGTGKVNYQSLKQYL